MRQHEDEVCLLRQCPGSGISLIEAGDSKSVDLKSGIIFRGGNSSMCIQDIEDTIGLRGHYLRSIVDGDGLKAGMMKCIVCGYLRHIQ